MQYETDPQQHLPAPATPKLLQSLNKNKPTFGNEQNQTERSQHIQKSPNHNETMSAVNTKESDKKENDNTKKTKGITDFLSDITETHNSDQNYQSKNIKKAASEYNNNQNGKNDQMPENTNATNKLSVLNFNKQIGVNNNPISLNGTNTIPQANNFGMVLNQQLKILMTKLLITASNN